MSPTIRLFPLDESPGRMLHRASAGMRAGLLHNLREAGYELSIEQWVVLSSLWEQNQMTQPELGLRVAKDRHYVSRLLDSLEARGLVTRKGTTDDRRVKRVKLTAGGQRAKTVLSRVLNRYLARVFRGFTQAEYDAFLASLRKIEENSTCF